MKLMNFLGQNSLIRFSSAKKNSRHFFFQLTFRLLITYHFSIEKQKCFFFLSFVHHLPNKQTKKQNSGWNCWCGAKCAIFFSNLKCWLFSNRNFLCTNSMKHHKNDLDQDYRAGNSSLSAVTCSPFDDQHTNQCEWFMRRAFIKLCGAVNWSGRRRARDRRERRFKRVHGRCRRTNRATLQHHTAMAIVNPI